MKRRVWRLSSMGISQNINGQPQDIRFALLLAPDTTITGDTIPVTQLNEGDVVLTKDEAEKIRDILEWEERYDLVKILDRAMGDANG